MKWNKIKDAVAGGLRQQIICSVGDVAGFALVDLIASNFEAVRIMRETRKDVHWHAVMELYAAEAEKVIDAWDIRAIGRLRDLFPGHFPPSLSKGRLVAFYDDAGAVQVAA